MKKVIFCLLISVCMAQMAYAAFPVKAVAPAATITAVTPTAATESKVIATHQHYSFAARVKNSVHAIFNTRAPWEGEPDEGVRAMFWAYFGLFIWPLGILAIIHGARGLQSHSGREQDRATIGLIFGIGEVIAAVAAIIWFVLFF